MSEQMVERPKLRVAVEGCVSLSILLCSVLVILVLSMLIVVVNRVMEPYMQSMHP